MVEIYFSIRISLGVGDFLHDKVVNLEVLHVLGPRIGDIIFANRWFWPSWCLPPTTALIKSSSIGNVII